MTQRDVVLITHANPEDNAFSRWLAARLVSSGYKVWIDLRSLRGGEDFWDLIDQTLRTSTIKQIVVVSKSLTKAGVKKELAIGDYIGKTLCDPSFMIPIRIEEILYGELPPELLRRNVIDALPNWAACLAPLLKDLDEANVPRRETPDGKQIRAFIAAQENGRVSITSQPELLWSNWFELTKLPTTLTFYGTNGTYASFEKWLESASLPKIVHSRMAATFCDQHSFQESSFTAPPRCRPALGLVPQIFSKDRTETPFLAEQKQGPALSI